jgi:hypothetical protein
MTKSAVSVPSAGGWTTTVRPPAVVRKERRADAD